MAARGCLLLTERWRVRPRAGMVGVLAIGALHAVFIAIMIHDVEARLHPWRIAYEASVAQPQPELVFLGSASDAFASKHANWNDARWRTAPTIFLNDPGAEQRDEVACRFHRRAYRVVTYDTDKQKVFVLDRAATCIKVIEPAKRNVT